MPLIHAVDGFHGSYVVKATSAAIIRRSSIANQTVWPYPIDMLHRTPRLLQHYLAQAGISCSGCTVRYCEVLARRVAGQEERDVPYRRGRIIRVRG
jgi:hypothetical protein